MSEEQTKAGDGESRPADTQNDVGNQQEKPVTSNAPETKAHGSQPTAATLPNINPAPGTNTWYAMQIGPYRPQVNWFFGHLVNDSPVLIPQLFALAKADTVPARWQGFKPIGDLVFDKWASDFPEVADMPTSADDFDAMINSFAARMPSAQGVELMRIGDGHIAEGLKNLLPIVIQYLPMILKLFGVPVPV